MNLYYKFRVFQLIKSLVNHKNAIAQKLKLKQQNKQ